MASDAAMQSFHSTALKKGDDLSCCLSKNLIFHQGCSAPAQKHTPQQQTPSLQKCTIRLFSANDRGKSECSVREYGYCLQRLVKVCEIKVGMQEQQSYVTASFACTMNKTLVPRDGPSRCGAQCKT